MSEKLCKFPQGTPPAPESNFQFKGFHPVGALVDPKVVGDVPKSKDETLRFYPCKPIERDLSGNPCGVAPNCPPATTYQRDFEYRGNDPRRCRTYEFYTDEEKCRLFYCNPPQNQPVKRFGRRSSDLKPAVSKNEKYGIDHGTASYDRENYVSHDMKSNITEYMANVSKLGDDIIKYNLYVRNNKRTAKNRI